MANHPADRRLSDTETAANAQAKHFGALVRERREALKMRQDDLALATGVGRRFILELAAGQGPGSRHRGRHPAVRARLQRPGR